MGTKEMAFSNLALLLPLLMVSLFFHSSSASVTVHVSNKLLDVICEETQNAEFCKITLGNYPRTGAASVDELGIISVILATEQARLNKFVVNEFLYNETDPVTKDHLANCLIDYTVLLGKLKDAYRLSDKKDYRGMIRLVEDAMKMTNKCEDGLNNLPSYPSPLTSYNQKMVWLNDIALVVLDVLDG